MAGELDALMAQFQLSDEERRRLLLGNALLGLGAGLAGGKPGDWLGSAAGGLATGAGLGQRAAGQDAAAGGGAQRGSAAAQRDRQGAQARTARRAGGRPPRQLRPGPTRPRVAISPRAPRRA